MPLIVLDTENTVHKTDKNPCLLGGYNLVEGDGKHENKKYIMSKVISPMEKNKAGKGARDFWRGGPIKLYF